MKLKPIKTNKEYKAWMDWVDIQFDKKIKPNTPEGEKLQVALMLIKDYEDRHYPIHLPDPIEAVKIKFNLRLMINDL